MFREKLHNLWKVQALCYKVKHFTFLQEVRYDVNVTNTPMSTQRANIDRQIENRHSGPLSEESCKITPLACVAAQCVASAYHAERLGRMGLNCTITITDGKAIFQATNIGIKVLLRSNFFVNYPYKHSALVPVLKLGIF